MCAGSMQRLWYFTVGPVASRLLVSVGSWNHRITEGQLEHEILKARGDSSS
jgi:hypothetical protein